MQSLKQLVTLSLFLSLINCAHYQLSDFQVSVTLPASLDCYSYNVLSGKETRLPANSKACIDKKLKAVWIDSNNYKMLKRDIQRNCQMAKCKQLTGAFDDLFLKMDQAIRYIEKK